MTSQPQAGRNTCCDQSGGRVSKYDKRYIFKFFTLIFVVFKLLNMFAWTYEKYETLSIMFNLFLKRLFKSEKQDKFRKNQFSPRECWVGKTLKSLLTKHLFVRTEKKLWAKYLDVWFTLLLLRFADFHNYLMEQNIIFWVEQLG